MSWVRKAALSAVTVASAALLAACATGPGSGPMGFFVTSIGSGKGGDLGGLAGADAHCQRLAAAAGAGSRTWRAYLSTPGTFPSAGASATPQVNARDRIGKGPWYNAKGELIARDVEHLHGDSNLTKATALDERGNVLPGGGDPGNVHDILTGSRADGTAFSPSTDTTCRSWTSSGEGSAIVGHHDRRGLVAAPWAQSWNFSHQTAGCSVDALRRTGGGGLFYCFATD